MIWVVAGAIGAGLVGWRWGLRGLIAAVAAVWLVGMVWLGLRGAPGPEGFARFAWWTVAGAALLLGLGYAALLRLLRGRAGGTVEARPGTTTAAPRAGAEVAPSPPLPLASAAATPPDDPHGPLTDPELDRYARHIVLRELGGAGQRRLRAARVLVVGAGGLGAPVLLYLAAAGVGRITVADDDAVGLSNLQRQVIFSTDDIGAPKAEAAAAALTRLNPHVAVTPLLRRITADDSALVGGHDLVLDGTDSFASRQAVNAACVAAGVPLIAGAIAQWEGQVALYDPARGGPCLACLFPEAPAPGLAPSCAEAGVVGALPGVVGSLMALEAVKLIAGIGVAGSPGAASGAGLRGQMVLFDGLWGDTRRLGIAARPGCPVCGGRGAVGPGANA